MNRLIGVGVAAVLLFDALAATASRAMGFRYIWASVGSFLIYLTIGAVATRYGGLRTAAIAGLCVGVVDATIGEAISRAIGPVRAALESNALWYQMLLAVEVALLAGIVSWLGGLAMTWSRNP